MTINKDQVQGRVEQVTGKIKEVTGEIIGNKDLKVTGNIQKNIGLVKAPAGDAKSDIVKTLKS